MKRELMRPDEIEWEDRAFELLQKAQELGSMTAAARQMGITDSEEILQLWKMADIREQDLKAELAGRLCQVSTALKELRTNLTEEAIQRLIQFIDCRP